MSSDISMLAAKIASSGALQARTERLRSETGAAATDHTKIEKAARDFESVLLGQWLEQAKQSFATVPGADPDQDQDKDPGQDQMQDLAMQSLAKSLASRGGLGIGRMIVKQLERAETASAPNTAELPVSNTDAKK